MDYRAWTYHARPNDLDVHAGTEWLKWRAHYSYSAFVCMVHDALEMTEQLDKVTNDRGILKIPSVVAAVSSVSHSILDHITTGANR